MGARMTTANFTHDKRVAVHAFVRELTGERVGPYGVDDEIVPYLFELNAIPGVYSWASCAGHDGRLDHGYVWVRLERELERAPSGVGSCRVRYPFQDDRRKIAFDFAGYHTLAADMAAVLEYLWGLAGLDRARRGGFESRPGRVS